MSLRPDDSSGTSAVSGGPARLPRPPSSFVLALPREVGDKPQEAAVAVNPLDARNLIVSYHQSMSEGSSDHHIGAIVHAKVASSFDGGRTWAVADRTTNENYRRSLDATVAFDLHGHAFLVYIGMDKISIATRAGEFVHRSLDGGKTWSAPVPLIELPGKDPVLNHMPNIISDTTASSPHAGNVYVLWDRQTYDAKSNDPKLLKTEIVLVRSTDDGNSWSKPRIVSGPFPTIVAHTMGLAEDGTLYAMYAGLAGMNWEIKITSSRDGGNTFETPLPVTVTQSPADPKAAMLSGFPRQGGWPVMAVDPRGSGRLFVVWGDARYGDRDIFITTSADRGRTWSEAKRVNDDAQGNGKDQVMQWIAVDPTDGSANVAFYDRRDDANNQTVTVTLARSTDGARTFTNYTWNGGASDPAIASLGDYLGIAAHSGRVYVAWPEPTAAPEKAANAFPKAPQKAGHGEVAPEDKDWPFGATVLKVGAADFNARGAGKSADAPR